MKNTLVENDIDIMLGSESHLSCNIFNSEFLPKHYTASRQDRADGKGGVIIIYKVSLLVEEIKQKSGEIISIKVKTFEKPILLTACYRSTESTKEQDQQLIDSLEQIISKHKNIPVWVGGDFNLPDINWDSKLLVITIQKRQMRTF